MTSATLVTRLDNVGDVLLAGPAVRAAASGRAGPRPVRPHGRGAAGLLPGVDGVVVHPAPWIVPDPMAVSQADALALVDQVRASSGRAGRHPGLVAPEPSGAAGRGGRGGGDRGRQPRPRGALLDHRITGDPDVHEVLRRLLVTRAGPA